MIDRTRLAALREDLGDADFPEVVALFLDEAGAVVAGLPESPQPAADLHFLKGVALNLGLSELAALCARPPEDGVDPRGISAAFARARTALSDLCRGPPAAPAPCAG